MKRNLLAALLLLIISLPSLTFIYWKVQEVLVRWEMQEKLEYTSLQTITLPVNMVEWYDKGREVLIEGNLFDVKSYYTRDNEIVLTGLFDAAETNIQNHVKELLKQQQEDEATRENAEYSFVSISLFTEQLPSWLINPPDNILTKRYQRDINKIPSVYLSLAVPPPEV